MRIPFVGSVTVIGLLQLSVIVYGILVAGVFRRIYLNEGAVRIPETVDRLARFGFLYILIPVAWVGFASWDIEENPEPILGLRGHLIFGFVALVALSYFIFMGALQSPEWPRKEV